MEMQYKTHLLDEIIQKKRESREKRRSNTIQRVFKVLKKLAEEISFQEAYLFGSVIRPHTFSENSDLDIGFTGLADKDFFKVMSFLSRETGRDVDVVQLEHHRLSEKIKNEGLLWKKKS